MKESHYSTAFNMIQAERRRQVMEKGYTIEHDDSHVNDELAALACFYVMPPAAREWDATETGYGATWGEAILPHNWSARGREDRIQELAIAGAVLVAELSRLLRARDAEKGKA